MTLQEFDKLIGKDSYVRCRGKIRKGKDILTLQEAEEHVESGGQVGWWVRPGYIVVDIDEGKEQALKIVKKLGLKTLMSQTPKGLHLFFKTEREFPQKVGMVLPCGLKCDFRCANKGYVIIPPGSKNRKFNKTKKVAQLPPEFTPMLGRKDSLLGLKEGDGRNTILFGHLMAYKNRGASQDDVEQMADVINDYVFNEPMDQNELAVIVGNTAKYESVGMGDNAYVFYNKNGFASSINHRALKDYFLNRGDTFTIGSDCYMYKDGVYVESSSYVRNIMCDLIAYDNLINQARIMECYRLICDDVRLKRSVDELNPNKNLINFKNGVWDIDNQELLPHSREYLQTLQIPHNVGKYVYFEDTRLYKFFMECQMKKSDIRMITQYMAYCLTLQHNLKTFMVLVGTSNTGKSVLIRFLTALVGLQNTAALSMHDLNQRFYPAQLYNRILNACADNSSLSLTSIDNLKKITGGDLIMHERKGKEPFFFTPFSKLIFSFNQLPLQLEEKSDAFFTRMRILYMNNKLDLTDDYVNELCSEESVSEVIPYLLSLLPLDAIHASKTSNKQVSRLHKDSDTIHAFMSNKCVVNPESYILRKKLYEAYVEYCTNTGREYHKKHNFNRNMRSMGYKEIRVGKAREMAWDNLSFKPKKGTDDYD